LDNQLQLEHQVSLSVNKEKANKKVSLSIKAQKGFRLNFFYSSGSHKEKETFKVSEYVLPKFSVEIKSPPAVLKNDDKVFSLLQKTLHSICDDSITFR
jgi:hypothetical protein